MRCEPTLDSLVEPGTVRVRGLATPIGSGGGQPLEHAGRTTWARLDLDALRERLPYPLLPVVVRQTPDSSLPRSPRRLPAPELDDGPHLNYAIQWFLFAGMAVAFAVLVVGRTKCICVSPERSEGSRSLMSVSIRTHSRARADPSLRSG